MAPKLILGYKPPFVGDIVSNRRDPEGPATPPWSVGGGPRTTPTNLQGVRPSEGRIVKFTLHSN